MTQCRTQDSKSCCSSETGVDARGSEGIFSPSYWGVLQATVRSAHRRQGVSDGADPRSARRQNGSRLRRGHSAAFSFAACAMNRNASAGEEAARAFRSPTTGAPGTKFKPRRSETPAAPLALRRPPPKVCRGSSCSAL